MSTSVNGIERAIFGEVDEATVDGWLDRFVRSRLSAGLQRTVLRRGRVSAVYALELADTRQVVVTVQRNDPDIRSLTAAVACQRWLADHGYPAPAPIDGPTVFDGHTAIIESFLADGSPADGHDPVVREALAASLAEQVRILNGAPELGAGLTMRPAW